MLGKELGHYKLLERICAGGMGEVYVAQDQKLNRKVALKILHADMADSAERRSRFDREAQAIAALNHPNIVTIHSVETVDDSPFITMELIEGRTLSELIPAGGMGIRKIFEIAMPLLDAVNTAHEQGIVHRDLKPDNIMVTTKGHVKVLDFGLAKLLEPEDGGAGGATVVGDSKTQEGRVMGTSAYMSPEQAEGKEIDPRSDIFSLGIVLYEMASGEKPFKGDTGLSTLTSILRDHPRPVTEIKSNLPNHLGRVIQRCLAKEPRRRYQTALDIQNELETIREELDSKLGEQSSISATPAPAPASQPSSSLPSWVKLGVPALLVAVVAVWFMTRQDAGVPETTSQTPTENASTPSERKSIVVFPFENLGNADDEYFAAGITEEITSRLARVEGLSVLSRTSATQYDKSGKTMAQIGTDLDVAYVLDGTVRWERHGDGTNRVRVTPQLISTSEDRQVWSNSYDRSMDEIFKVQTDIAESVVGALDMTLGGASRVAMDERPTDNMDAYHAYLRGNSIFGGVSFDHEQWEVALDLFKRAVELDPEFIQAYSALSQVHSGFIHFGWDWSEDRLAKAKAAADRATALDPDSPWTKTAWGYYHYWGRKDYTRALQSLQAALVDMPGEAELHRTVAWVKRRQGDFEGAIASLQPALELDPRNARTLYGFGETHRILGNYAEAETFFNRAISLAPDGHSAYIGKAWNTLLWSGDVNEARRTLDACPLRTPDIADMRYRVEMWARDYPKALRIAHSLEPVRMEQFYAICAPLRAGDIYALMDRPEEARAAYDSARVVLEEKASEFPENAQIRSALGLAYAGLGMKDAAAREGRKGVELMPASRDAWIAQMRILDLARIHTVVGNHESALDELERLAAIPTETISPARLRITPWMDPLRENPRFQKLLDDPS